MPKFDQYYWSAEYAPAILTSVPLALIVSFLVHQPALDLQPVKLVWDFLQVTPVLFSAALSFLLIQINIFLAKTVFQQPAESLPSTELLLHQDRDLGIGVKERLRQQIKTEFGIELFSQQQEEMNSLEARRWIVEAVSRIKEQVRANKLVRKRLIAYSFIRNLLGGSLLATVLSIGGLVLFFALSHRPFTLIGCAVGYGLVCLAQRPLLRHFGQEYAKTLFQQYTAFPTTLSTSNATSAS